MSYYCCCCNYCLTNPCIGNFRTTNIHCSPLHTRSLTGSVRSQSKARIRLPRTSSTVLGTSSRQLPVRAWASAWCAAGMTLGTLPPEDRMSTSPSALEKGTSTSQQHQASLRHENGNRFLLHTCIAPLCCGGKRSISRSGCHCASADAPMHIGCVPALAVSTLYIHDQLTSTGRYCHCLSLHHRCCL